MRYSRHSSQHGFIPFILLIGGCAGGDQAQERWPCCPSFTFEPTVAEKLHLRAGLLALQERLALDGVHVEISRMAPESAADFIFVRDAGTIEFYILGRDSLGHLSARFDTEVPNAETLFAPLAIADLDADGAWDFAYCTWHEDPSPKPPQVVGYREGNWYRIHDPVSAVSSDVQWYDSAGLGTDLSLCRSQYEP